jgi:hypothetical protein
MTKKVDHEAENRGVRYEPSKKPNQYSQELGSKPPTKQDRERDNEDNKTS